MLTFAHIKDYHIRIFLRICLEFFFLCYTKTKGDKQMLVFGFWIGDASPLWKENSIRSLNIKEDATEISPTFETVTCAEQVNLGKLQR